MAVYKGKDAQIKLGDNVLEYAESASVDIGRGSEGYYEIGSPNPKEVVQGNTEITGSISRVWMDTTLAELVGTPATAVLTVFNLSFQASNVSGAPLISLTSCIVETAMIDISQDGYVMGDIDFVATDYSITTVA